MSIKNMKKQAGILENIPFTRDWDKRNLSNNSQSYRIALSLLGNLHKSMGNCISIQKEHLNRAIRFGKAMKLQDFAKHVDGFMKEQSKITFIANDKNLRDSFIKLLENIESELYGEPNVFPSQEIVSEITSTTSIPSSLNNPPAYDWVGSAQEYLKSIKKPSKRLASAVAEANKSIKKEALFDGWWNGNNYYGKLQRGQSLKNGIEQITSVLKDLYFNNKNQYKILAECVSKGDPDEYYDNMKQLAITTQSSSSQILTPWIAHFAKYIKTAEEPLEVTEPLQNAEPSQIVEPSQVAEPLNENVDTTSEKESKPIDADESIDVVFDDDDDTDIAPGMIEPSSSQQPEVKVDESKVETEPVQVEPAQVKPTKEVKPKEKRKSVKSSLDILDDIYKSASLGNPYITANHILLLANCVDEDGDSQLADELTKIAQEALDE